MYEVLIHEENKIKKFGLSHDRVLFENYFQIIRRKKNEDQAANDLDESVTADRQDRPPSRQYLQTDLNVSLFKHFYFARFVQNLI